GAPPPVRNGLPATPPPPADIRTRGGCSYSGFGLLRYVLCRSTALGAKRVCRQLRRRRLAFAPGAGAPTVGSGFSDMFCVGAPPSVRNGYAGNSAAAGWHSHPGRVLLQRVRASPICSVQEHRPRCETGLPATPPPPADIRTRGGCSYSGFGLLRYVLCRSTAPVRNGFAGNSAAGWHSHPGRVLLRWARASPISSA